MASDPQIELRVSRLENDRNSIYELITDIRSTQQEHSRRFDTVAGRFDTMAGRFDTVAGRFDTMENRFDTRRGSLRQHRGDNGRGCAAPPRIIVKRRGL